ncbi:MAG: hypothetical protein ACEPOW_07455 [Bacteroidales bacterium]
MLPKKIYLAAGYNTISMGSGRKEFNPKLERPGLKEYMREAGRGCLDQLSNKSIIDEVVIGNFMAARFNKQGNLPGFAPFIDKMFLHKSAVSVEGACCSGGLALFSAIKSVLSGTLEASMALGVEVQNTVKAIYGADILAGAACFEDRKSGHAYFFPGQFSLRAESYSKAYGADYFREAACKWYINAIENARLCHTAQEYQNNKSYEDLRKFAMTRPNGSVFVDGLNLADCSKVSDGASSIGVFSEEGLKQAGIDKKDSVELISFAQVVRDITQIPEDYNKLSTIKFAIEKALKEAKISIDKLATIELHDCFSVAGILIVEALGYADQGKGAQFVIDGHTSRKGKIPVNTTGGLVGWGHPTGATGVHQAVTIWQQLTGKAEKAQIEIPSDKPYGMSINMGGDDVTVFVTIYKKVE